MGFDSEDGEGAEEYQNGNCGDEGGEPPVAGGVVVLGPGHGSSGVLVRLVDTCEWGGSQVERLGFGRAPTPGCFCKNVILGWLRVRAAQECDFKGVGGGGSVRGTPEDLGGMARKWWGGLDLLRFKGCGVNSAVKAAQGRHTPY